MFRFRIKRRELRDRYRFSVGRVILVAQFVPCDQAVGAAREPPSLQEVRVARRCLRSPEAPVRHWDKRSAGHSHHRDPLFKVHAVVADLAEKAAVQVAGEAEAAAKVKAGTESRDFIAASGN